MNEKIARQIEEMKKQTIGVEVEITASKERKQRRLQPPTSEQTDMNTQQAETDTKPGQLGMSKAENGNSKRMSVLPDATVKNANW